MSRYNRGYDGDRRSRSPHRSPDRFPDRALQYGDGDRRRPSGDTRVNQSAFQANREFRDPLTGGREPPRGPKALIDSPGPPRGGYSDGFRGRGPRGRGGRAWRDDSRDRTRERDDYRNERRDAPFRDERGERTERSRERERDWRDQRDSFRGRRPSPQGRGRSPPGREPARDRDFRDRDRERDGPLGVDAERARRGSRDGPLSAGSSNSDQPFGAQSYRGGGFRGGRGRGRGGGGEWPDRGRRPGFFDERDRYRSRSQDGRWAGRDVRDDRVENQRLGDDPRASRDLRDDRDSRDRDLIRPKTDRASLTHELPTSAKEVSPPPLAPSAPAFGSVVASRATPTALDMQTPTGKAPPTGPRALTEERPLSAGHQGAGSGGGDRLPSTGASKAPSHDGSPPIPTGPRAQHQKQQQQQPQQQQSQQHQQQQQPQQPQQQRPSSKQWINPALAGKKIPESPKVNRSQSFVSQHPRPFGPRPASSGSENHVDLGNRPRSSDAQSDSHMSTGEAHLRSLHQMIEPGEIVQDDHERGTLSARTSVDGETMRPPWFASDSHMSGTGYERPASVMGASPTYQRPPTLSPTQSRSGKEGQQSRSEPTPTASTPRRRKPTLRFAPVKVSVPPPPPPPPPDQSSESDDEDMNDYFQKEIQTNEAELKKLESESADLPAKNVFTYAYLVQMAALAFADEPEGLVGMLGKIPEGVRIPRKPSQSAAVKPAVAQQKPPHGPKEPKEPTSTVPANTKPAKSIDRDAKGAPKEIKAIEKETKGVGKETKAAATDPKAPAKEAKVVEKVDKVVPKETKAVEKDAKSVKEAKAAEKDTKVTENKAADTPASLVPASVKAGPSRPPPALVSIPEPAATAPAPTDDTVMTDKPTHDAPPSAGKPAAETVTADAKMEPQPKVEDVEMVDAHVPIPTVEREDPRPEEADVVMQGTTEAAEVAPGQHGQEAPKTNGVVVNGDVPKPTVNQEMVPGKVSPARTEDDDDATEIEEPDCAAIETVRQFMVTPPLDSLPIFDVTPWHEDKMFIKSMEPRAGVASFVLDKLKRETSERAEDYATVQRDYREKYNLYLRFTLSDDPSAVRSRDKFAVSTGFSEPAAAPPPPPQEPKAEGRGRRFATERDLERILQASKAEEEQRRERELRAEKEMCRSEKEAVIPDMYWNDDERKKQLFMDRSGYVPVEKLVAAWQVLPPVCNFTPEEEALFEKAYLECPKQWGKIAEQIPKRTFGSCIQYYYLKKRDLHLKEKLKKQPKKRKKGRGKARSSALVSELGNGDHETEENHENGENGERRRPRRAAAPTFSFEAAATPNNADSDGATPSGTPGRRTGANKGDSGAEKPEGKKGRKRQPKEKKAETPKVTPIPLPRRRPRPSRTDRGRTSRVPRARRGPEWNTPQTLGWAGDGAWHGARPLPPPFEPQNFRALHSLKLLL
ncbi:hypothetical protein MAPG_11831, partial [Magnaporthiopsis poae ATCC 64411]